MNEILILLIPIRCSLQPMIRRQVWSKCEQNKRIYLLGNKYSSTRYRFAIISTEKKLSFPHQNNEQIHSQWYYSATFTSISLYIINFSLDMITITEFNFDSCDKRVHLPYNMHSSSQSNLFNRQHEKSKQSYW